MSARKIVILATLIAASASLTMAAELPSSERSREVIERKGGLLSEELRWRGLQYGAPIFLRIFKDSSELELWVEDGNQFRLFRTYDICTFSGDLGPKLRTGDEQSPEGFYFVTPSRMNPWSNFHLSFDLGYPNAYDRHRGRTGGALMVHGGCASIGCYAMTDAGIEEIYILADAALRNGQPFFRVHVFPFRMTYEAMEDRRGSRWNRFWKDLQEGYEFFERNQQPPSVEVCEGEYVFTEP